MKEEKEQTVIDKTLLYLENYREMERYIKEAVSETSQVPDIGKYNISAERALESAVQRRSFCSSISNRLLHHSKRMQRQQVRGTSTTHLRQSISRARHTRI